MEHRISTPVLNTIFTTAIYKNKFQVLGRFILRRTNRLRQLVRLRRLVPRYKQQVAIMSRFLLVKVKSSV